VAGDSRLKWSQIPRSRQRQRCAKAVVQHLYRLLGADTDLNAVNIPKLVGDYIRQRRKETGPGGKPIGLATIRKELLIV
jgi:hypothetical protein